MLLLDEPLSALDAQVRVQLREEIRRIQLELGITTVFVTHDQAEALSVADRVGVLRSGRLEQVASPDELYERPATAFVAEFVGTMNRAARDGLPRARCSCSAPAVRSPAAPRRRGRSWRSSGRSRWWWRPTRPAPAGW